MPLDPELFRALGALCEPPDPAHARLAGALGLPGSAQPADYTDLFVLQLVPYASVYLGADGMLGGDAVDRVAGFWRALRLDPPREPDHLAGLLGLYATLAEQERSEPDRARVLMWREARRALLWEHLLTWVPPYTAAAADVAAPFYAAWARLLGETMYAAARVLPAPQTPPLHLRDRPDGPDVEQGVHSLVRRLLSPVRSGLILTRADLARGARHGGTGLRQGERAFALRAMLGQDPVATFGWLTDEAGRWVCRHRSAEPVLGTVAVQWGTRAAATRRALRSALASAEELARATRDGHGAAPARGR